MKFNRNVDSLSNLEAVVIHDLRNIGVKIPKIRKQSEQQNHSVVSKERCGVFGQHLYQLPCSIIENYGVIPKFLMEIIDFIEKDIDVEGIFRRSGSVAKLKELRVKIDAGESVLGASVLDFSGLLKQFLRELPEPLLTSQMQDAFLGCYELSPPSKRIAAILLLCHLLPRHNLSTLRYICAFLRRVVDRSVHNKMDAANVAICLAPNIFHAVSASAVAGSDATKSMLTGQAGVVELLIDHADEIGVVSDDLHERVAMMTECFSDSVVDDCELETTDCREKKRSGSFQGLVSNLSNSFTKWRNKDKHNTSTVSSSCSEAIVGDYDWRVNKESFMLDSHTGATVTPQLRKRKAEDDTTAFSIRKRQAIVRHLPQMSTLGTTPYTPSSLARKGKLIDADSSTNTLAVKDVDVVETTFDCEGKHHTGGGSRVRRGNSLDSSPNYSARVPKSKVRKSFEGLIRRLSGGRDSQVQQKVSSKQDELQDDEKPRRSPSALTFSSPLFEHNHRVIGQFSVNKDMCQKRQSTARRQRSLSADSASIANTSLRRGRPNTIKSGLPSPVNRQISDPIGCRIPMNSSTSVDPDDTSLPAAVIDTSPILSKSESYYIKQDCEGIVPTHRLIHQISKESVGSFSMDESSENTLDQAFIGSVLETDNIISACGVDLDVTGSSASTVDEHSVSTCSTGTDDDVIIGSQMPSTPLDHRRPLDPMERYIVLPDRPASHVLSSSSSLSVPKIKPSLMPSTVTSRLLNKVNCSPRMCSDSPVSSGRLVARSKFTDAQN